MQAPHTITPVLAAARPVLRASYETSTRSSERLIVKQHASHRVQSRVLHVSGLLKRTKLVPGQPKASGAQMNTSRPSRTRETHVEE